MSFHLSERSLSRFAGVKPELVEVTKIAITLTRVDFGVSCGVRTLEEQRKLVASGASNTMKSKHLTGEAVDLFAYIGSRASWELSLYDDIACAMKTAAQDVGCSIRWGAAWHIDDITRWNSTMQDAADSYIDTRRAQGRRPFIDGPHFELT